MKPRLDYSFKSLPGEQKLFYLTGMPRSTVIAPDYEPLFANVRLSDQQALSTTTQKEKYAELLKGFPTDGFSVFASHPSDQEALHVASMLVKHYIRSDIKDIEYVLPGEHYPRDTERLKSLYVLMGVHEDDKNLVHDVRRWVRGPIGVPRFLVLTSNNPYQWCLDRLGCKPDFLFSMRQVGKFLG